MKRWLFFAYGVMCHLLFLGTFLYMAGFVGNFLVPKSIDSAIQGPLGQAIAINLLLLGAFGLQHSVMARPGFKNLWTRIVPRPIERATYVLLSSVLLIVLMWQWRPIQIEVWNVQWAPLRALLWACFAVGWLLVPLVTLMIDHFDLFGTRQVWLYLQGRPYQPLPFRAPLLYKHVRHPLYIGWAIAFFATPTMTAGHLLFAVVLTAYMGLAAVFEERDLVTYLGSQYANYRRHVPMFVPRLKPARLEPSGPSEPVGAVDQISGSKASIPARIAD